MTLHVVKQIAVTVLVLSVIVLTFLAVLSIWEYVSSDLFYKSLSTMGVIAFASVIVLLAIRYLEGKQGVDL